MRVVADVNVLVSALLSPRGAPAEVLRRWRDGEVALLVSLQLIAELERVLSRPRVASRVTQDEVRGFVALLGRHAELVGDAVDVPQRSRDPNDDYLLALAERERAYVVTGDRDLLELAGELPVLTPRELIDRLDERTFDG